MNVVGRLCFLCVYEITQKSIVYILYIVNRPKIKILNLNNNYVKNNLATFNKKVEKATFKDIRIALKKVFLEFDKL